jgi:hypothetical protein
LAILRFFIAMGLNRLRQLPRPRLLKSADKTSFLRFLQPNCLRSVQSIQGWEKLFDL